jgi:hypothetical protein
MSETNWNKLIGNLIGVAMRSWQSNERLNTACAALLSAIKAVEKERDEYCKITDVPEGHESAFYSCDKCGNYLPRISALEHQLREAKSQLAEAEADAERLFGFTHHKPQCSCISDRDCDCGLIEAKILHRANLAGKESKSIGSK